MKAAKNNNDKKTVDTLEANKNSSGLKKFKIFNNKYGYIIHPFLFAMFPLLSFYGANLAEIKAGNFNMNVFILFNLVVGIIAWGISFLATRNPQKASIITFALLVVFFMFGRVHSAIQGLAIKTPIIVVGPTKLLLGLSLVFAIAVWLWIRRLKPKTITKVNATLSLVGIVMIISALTTLITAPATGNPKTAKVLAQETVQSTAQKTKSKTQPDIYYILLDGYTRGDYLRQNFNFDNSAFLKSLNKRGFYVADKANSNYAHTHFSVPSTFNMKYLNYLADKVGEKSKDRTPLRELLYNNSVVLKLKSDGYKYVNIGTQWGWSKTSPLQDIEVKANNETESEILGFPLDEVALVYLQTTALKPWIEKDIRTTMVAQILNAIDKTKQVAKIAEPTISFTHFLAPHPPYLFDKNGIIPGQTPLEFANQGFSDRPKYVEQTIYTNKFVLDIVDNILRDSQTPPIIIIASDHGSAASLGTSDFVNINPNDLNEKGVKERMGILNAYYFPDKNYKNLYPTITPVNSFRVIFKQFFGEDIDLLPDRSYFSSNRDKEYQMFDVTELVD